MVVSVKVVRLAAQMLKAMAVARILMLYVVVMDCIAVNKDILVI